MKEILLLPNTDWQQKYFIAVFSVLMTVTASAILVREAAKEGQEIDCHSAVATLQKEPRNHAVKDAQEASVKGDKGTEGKNTGLRDTLSIQACLWNLRNVDLS